MRPISNQLTHFFATAQTHKFNTTEDINNQDLKLRPILDQTGTYIYNASKVIANYLKPLANDDFIIIDTLSFPDMLKEAVNSEDYEDLSHDVESLFTSIPVKETIEYISNKIYVDKLMKPFCKKSIFKKLLVKLTKECIFFCEFQLNKAN